MEISWNISEDESKYVADFIEAHFNTFVANRISRNVNRQGLLLNCDTFIKAMLVSTLTAHQYCGPFSNIGNFFRLEPFPVTYKNLSNEGWIQDYIHQTLKQYGIIVDINKLPDHFSKNFQQLEDTNWELLQEIEMQLLSNNSKQKEREMADKIDRAFKGFGAVEARLLLQILGLTKYEIPIDAIVINWIKNNIRFPVTLTTIALQETNYYHFVSDAIQMLCEKANVFPCVLEAAIFSSYDHYNWTAENIYC